MTLISLKTLTRRTVHNAHLAIIIKSESTSKPSTLHPSILNKNCFPRTPTTITASRVLVSKRAEAGYTSFDPVVLVTQLNLGIRLRHERGAEDRRFIARNLNPGHEVCRMTRSGQRSCSRQHLQFSRLHI